MPAHPYPRPGQSWPVHQQPSLAAGLPRATWPDMPAGQAPALDPPPAPPLRWWEVPLLILVALASCAVALEW